MTVVSTLNRTGFIVFLLLMGCSTPDPVVEQPVTQPSETQTPVTLSLSQRIEAAENLWDEQQITGYNLEIVTGSPWRSDWFSITLEAGEIVDASTTCRYDDIFGSDCPPYEAFEPGDFTVPALFARLYSYAGTEAEQWIDVEFDEEYGFPRAYSYDEEDSLDEEWWLEVTAFETSN